MKLLLAGTMLLGLGASTAFAADLPSRRAPPVYVPPPILAYSWTGFEAGLQSSYVFGGGSNVRVTGRGTPGTDVRPGSFNTSKSGFGQVGAQLGYNYQFTPGSGVVIGGFVSYDWVDLRKNAYVRANATQQSVFHQRLSNLGLVNGKIGYAFDRLLVYGTGGLAVGDPGYGGTFLAANGNVNYFGGNNGQLKTGYDFGGGIAYAITDDSFINNFAIEKYLGLDKMLGFRASTTLKVEYIHYDFGSSTAILNGTAGNPGSYALRFRNQGNQVRAGLFYSFGGTVAPVVARY